MNWRDWLGHFYLARARRCDLKILRLEVKSAALKARAEKIFTAVKELAK